MSTLATVRNEVKANLTIVESSQDSAIDGYIRTSLRNLRQKRYWFLRRKQNISLGQGEYSASLPSDFSVIDTANLLYDGRRYTNEDFFSVVDYNDLMQFYVKTATRQTRKPSACALAFSSDLEVDTLADRNCTIELIYYAQDATLPTDDGDTSIWFDDGYDLVRASTQFLYAQFNEGDTSAPASEMTAFRQRLDEKQEFYKATGQL